MLNALKWFSAVCSRSSGGTFDPARPLLACHHGEVLLPLGEGPAGFVGCKFFENLMLQASPKVVSGAILVEVVFSYPGVGNLLYQAIRIFDYFVIYGVAFMVIVAIGLATLVLDLVLPVLDPRITY